MKLCCQQLLDLFTPWEVESIPEGDKADCHLHTNEPGLQQETASDGIVTSCHRHNLKLIALQLQLDVFVFCDNFLFLVCVFFRTFLYICNTNTYFL